jgi:hypothetical protein
MRARRAAVKCDICSNEIGYGRSVRKLCAVETRLTTMAGGIMHTVHVDTPV